MAKNFSTNSFIAGVMLGVLVTGTWLYGGTPAFFSMSSMPVATSTAVSLQKSGSISVLDQSAGGTVTVESVTVPPPGVWVAVREVIAGDLGNVLGAVRVSGPRSGITVPLLRETESGRSYVVQLYRDDGNGIFDVAVNSVYVDFDTGARVVAYFTTTN